MNNLYLSSISDDDIVDFLTFYLVSRRAHLAMARKSKPSGKLEALHLSAAKGFEKKACKVENLIKARKLKGESHG